MLSAGRALCRGWREHRVSLQPAGGDVRTDHLHGERKLDLHHPVGQRRDHPDQLPDLRWVESLHRCRDQEGGVTVTGGTLQAYSTATVNNDCGPLTAGVAMPTMTGTILWHTKSSGATAVGTDIRISSPWIYYQYDYNLLTLGFPTQITFGSYFGETVRYKTLYSNASGGALTGQCGTGQSGLKTIFFGKPVGAAMGSVTIQAGI